MPFRALGLGPRILKAIEEAGYTEPTPIQIKAISIILKRKDVIGTAQTGTGKTAAYVWPILERLAASAAPSAPRVRKTRVLVLVPTRELAVQVEESVRAYAKHVPIQCASVYGGVGETPQIRALRSHVDIVAATPGRLLDLLSRMPDTFRDLDTLVLDEADRMLDMGFLPDIRRIVRMLPRERQTLLFSATFSEEIEKVSREFLGHPERVEVGRRTMPTHSVTQFVFEVSPGRKTSLLLHLLKDKDLHTVLVFTRTKRGADKLARRLEDENFSTTTLHANRSQSQRQAALKGFKSGRYRILVATDIAARGIDVDGISHVVNYDFPAQPEDYVHRIGRTGRAAAIGDALSFVTPEDRGSLRSLEHFIGRGIPRLPVDAAVELEAPARRVSHAGSGDGRREGMRQGGRQSGMRQGGRQEGMRQGGVRQGAQQSRRPQESRSGQDASRLQQQDSRRPQDSRAPHRNSQPGAHPVSQHRSSQPVSQHRSSQPVSPHRSSQPVSHQRGPQPPRQPAATHAAPRKTQPPRSQPSATGTTRSSGHGPREQAEAGGSSGPTWGRRGQPVRGRRSGSRR